ncbi:MAG: protease modulator HflC [Gammaproteobacteria bacterium]|jgi:membrane protease subunit HflC|nr:protease modulator HflC [Gammaproteobacteria bacterium]MBP6053177.1 protease modulator HflC [Pseudomonadales bacterium]MBK6582684.1 protease modulator HflC [Gammaproteobacteria bacterium]MBK7167956.1 protease modulator HflC [Gammaproteobacteria bacterium]MBK7518814.1 protease modulator HflC [Gammaproteobacteria bacterium]
MNGRMLAFLAALGLALVALLNTLYVIKATECAVVLRFGRLLDVDSEPGLHFKIPLVDEVRKFNSRILTLDSEPESFYTLEKKRLIVDSFTKWRIEDVKTYYRATGGVQSIAETRLAQRANDGLRNQFGKRRLHEVVSGQREELMSEITDDLNSAVTQSLGIRVVDVRVKKIDLPEEVSDAVFKRMSAEREKLAREYRAQGKEQAEKIRADADRQVTILEAEAYRDAELVRGDGDAEAAAIYAVAFNKAPEFYSFTRSLRAYEESFASPQDMLVLDPKSDFFRYLNQSKPGR